MSKLDNTLAKFGMIPIQCGYDNPNCVSGYQTNWGSGVVVPIRDIPPYFPVYISGGGVINHTPPPNQLECEDGQQVKYLPNGSQVCVPIVQSPTINPTIGTDPFTQEPANVPTVLGTTPANTTPLNTTIDTIKAKIAANPLPALLGAAIIGYLLLKDGK